MHSSFVSSFTEFVPLSFIAAEAPMISTSAGAPHGQFLHPAEMRKWIRDARRTPVPRSTTYRTLRSFEQEPAEAEPSWIHDGFGSYGQLIVSQEFRFRDRHEGCR